MNFSIILRAGITCAEAAAIVGISHVSMWKYLRGDATPRRNAHCKRRLEVLLAVLEKLVANSSLPKLDIGFAKRMHPEKRAKRDVLLSKLKKLVDDRVDIPPANQ